MVQPDIKTPDNPPNGSSTPFVHAPSVMKFPAQPGLMSSESTTKILTRIDQMENRMNQFEKKLDRLDQKLDRLDELEHKIDMVNKTLKLEVGSDFVEDLKAELRVTVNEPIVDKIMTSWIKTGEVRWPLLDEIERMKRFRSDTDQKLQMIINELQRIRQPYHNGILH